MTSSPLTLQDAREATERGELLVCRWGCVERVQTVSVEEDPNQWFAMCWGCGQGGPVRESKADASRDWNLQQVPRVCEGKTCV